MPGGEGRGGPCSLAQRMPAGGGMRLAAALVGLVDEDSEVVNGAALVNVVKILPWSCMGKWGACVE